MRMILMIFIFSKFENVNTVKLRLASFVEDASCKKRNSEYETSMSGEKCDQSIVSRALKAKTMGLWRQACSQARIRSDHFSRLLEINIVHSVVLAFSYNDMVLCSFS